ncbi:MAG: hypothetical protein RL757_499 [Bacteroidota bacterium]|jgi:nitrite reductase/ring-hydroxylating ferredoxin subunit
MDRRDFLSQLGLGAAFVLTATCVGACKSDTAPTTVNLTVDLTSAEAVNLKTNGGYFIKDGVVIARTTSGGYAAASLTCSHDAEKKVQYATNGWKCTAHGATFAENGTPTNNVTSKTLVTYTTAVNGNTLTIS